MGRKGRRRSAAQIRHTENMKQRRRASPGQAEEIAEVYRCMTIEEYKRRMMTAEREVEKGLNDLKNAERRLDRMADRMAEKAETAKCDLEELETELDKTKKRAEAETADCAHWKEKTKELRRALRRIKERESRGPKGISSAVESAIAALAAGSGKHLIPPGTRVKRRVWELVNELAFAWRLPTPMISGIVDSVSRATVEVCYGGDIDDVDIKKGKHHKPDEHGGGPVPDAMVAGPSNAVVPPPEESSRGEGI